jgi:8-oxo-dGTP pyrophosphatase MutT (NUDIX family)
MVAGSILPVTIHKNQLFFLFGKENPMENSSKGWSDFGGGGELNETPFETAMREGAEELSGFLGSPTQLRDFLKGRVYEIVYNDYHVHLFFLPYDSNLPSYYNNNHRFLWDRMDKQILNKSKLFEKIEIKWFSIPEMKRRKNEFRHFYRKIVDCILEECKPIETFIKGHSHHKTNKKRKHNTRNRTIHSYHTKIK